MNRKVGAIYEKALRPHGIRASQLNILVAVSAFGPVTSQQVCRVLHMDTSTFSRAMTRLKKKAWLEVKPSGDGKILKIEITPAGFEKMEQVYPAWEEAQAKAIEIMGASTSETIMASGNKHLLGGITR